MNVSNRLLKTGWQGHFYSFGSHLAVTLPFCDFSESRWGQCAPGGDPGRLAGGRERHRRPPGPADRRVASSSTWNGFARGMWLGTRRRCDGATQGDRCKGRVDTGKFHGSGLECAQANAKEAS